MVGVNFVFALIYLGSKLTKNDFVKNYFNLVIKDYQYVLYNTELYNLCLTKLTAK